MDEQTTTQQSSYDVSADGAAYSGYEEEPLQATPEGQSTPEADEELAPDGLRVRDGEIEFGSEFFGDMKDSQEDEPPSPNWYTDKELEEIPFQQWDMSRLNGDIPVSRIAPIVQRQLQQAQIQRQAQSVEKIPLPPEIAEVKPYTPQELNAEALKLACEKLGISDVDDYDSYENEHKAAYELASRELIQRREAEIASYQTAARTWPECNRYLAELPRRADNKEFTQWVADQCQKQGVTIEQVNAGLYNTARQNGNNFAIIPQFIEGLYREFHQMKPKPKAANAQGFRRVPSKPAPAVLESTGGNNYAGRPSIRAEAFANMTNEEQERALIQLGYV